MDQDHRLLKKRFQVTGDREDLVNWVETLCRTKEAALAELAEVESELAELGEDYHLLRVLDLWEIQGTLMQELR